MDAAELRLAKYKTLAVDKHLYFVSYVWQNPAEPFVVGRHTMRICGIIDEAIARFRNNESVFYVITIPFRHGKSELLSRKLPAHFLGLFPDCKVILAGHTAELTEGFSKQSRNLISTKQYQDLFTGIIVNPKASSGAHWHIDKHQGECFACGLGGSMSGQGYHLGLLDDFCRSRADAESETMRERMWDAFTNDFMTRRAPISITIVLATRWHTDDIIARIIRHKKDDPHFPRFEVINMPAFSDEYATRTLFPERFSQQWYDAQQATLGDYGAAALLQCEPTVRGGNMLNTECIQRHKSLDEYPRALAYYRIWDLAHTAKERMKPDPDYTSGTLLAFQNVNGVWHIWIKDVCRFRKDAPDRDRVILAITEQDGAYVRVGIENSVDAKDAYVTLSRLLAGTRTVCSARGRGDKVIRVTPLEPIFKAGNVHVLDGAAWLRDWLAEVAAFPFGAHDDMVDNLSAGYVLMVKQRGGITSIEMTGI
jgi:predicted phage terminase large subunit-like protein